MKKIRWGLIGCGDISRKRVAPALRDEAGGELVAVSRARAALAESFAQEFGARRGYGDWRDLLNDQEIDAVYLATPVHLHAEQTIAAANAGKHVLCEKPMALSVAECDEMMAACEKNQVSLGIAYYRRFYPALERIRHLLQSGEIGQPMLAQINAFESFNPDSSHPRAWLIDKAKAGGGPMMDFGCHRIELLMHLFGHLMETVSVNDQLRFTRSVEDTSAAFFKFDSGVRATLTVTHTVMESQDTLDIFCTEGSIHIASLNHGEMRIKTRQSESVESHPPHDNLHLPLIADFTQAILHQRQPAVSAATGREVSRILELIYK
jgi:predicted dehydrogenase